MENLLEGAGGVFAIEGGGLRWNRRKVKKDQNPLKRELYGVSYDVRIVGRSHESLLSGITRFVSRSVGSAF